MSKKYHGEVLDDGKDFMAIDSDSIAGPVVSVKFCYEGLTCEMLLGADQAQDMARHLNAAADTAIG